MILSIPSDYTPAGLHAEGLPASPAPRPLLFPCLTVKGRALDRPPGRLPCWSPCARIAREVEITSQFKTYPSEQESFLRRSRRPQGRRGRTPSHNPRHCRGVRGQEADAKASGEVHRVAVGANSIPLTGVGLCRGEGANLLPLPAKMAYPQ